MELDQDLNRRYLDAAEEIAAQIGAMPQNRAVVVIGSVAEQTADRHSDIDLLVLYREEPEAEEIASALSQPSVGTYRFDENHFHVHLNKEDPHITLLFTPAARIQGFVESYPDIDFNDYAELSSYIVNGRLLHGDEEEFASWQRACVTIPMKMKVETVRHTMGSLYFWFQRDALLTLAHRKDWIMFNRTISECVVIILRVIYLLNDRIMIKPKRTRIVLDQCKFKPVEIAQKLEDLYLHRNSLEDAMAKVAQGREILRDLVALISEQLPDASRK